MADPSPRTRDRRASGELNRIAPSRDYNRIAPTESNKSKPSKRGFAMSRCGISLCVDIYAPHRTALASTRVHYAYSSDRLSFRWFMGLAFYQTHTVHRSLQCHLGLFHCVDFQETWGTGKSWLNFERLGLQLIDSSPEVDWCESEIDWSWKKSLRAKQEVPRPWSRYKSRAINK